MPALESQIQYLRIKHAVQIGIILLQGAGLTLTVINSRFQTDLDPQGTFSESMPCGWLLVIALHMKVTILACQHLDESLCMYGISTEGLPR